MEKPFMFLTGEEVKNMLSRPDFVGFKEKALKTCHVIVRSQERVPKECREWYHAFRMNEYIALTWITEGFGNPVVYLYTTEHWEKIQSYLQERMAGEGLPEDAIRLERHFWRMVLMRTYYLGNVSRSIHLPEMDMATLQRDCGENELLSFRAYCHKETGTVILLPVKE